MTIENMTDFKTERSGKVLLVPDHDINVSGDLAIHFLRLRETTDRTPERRTVVEVVADDRAVFLSSLAGLNRQFGGRFAESRKNPSSVEPASTLFSENIVPVDVARLELRG